MQLSFEQREWTPKCYWKMRNRHTELHLEQHLRHRQQLQQCLTMAEECKITTILNLEQFHKCVAKLLQAFIQSPEEYVKQCSHKTSVSKTGNEGILQHKNRNRHTKTVPCNRLRQCISSNGILCVVLAHV
jgi:hypothetical protein